VSPPLFQSWKLHTFFHLILKNQNLLSRSACLFVDDDS